MHRTMLRAGLCAFAAAALAACETQPEVDEFNNAPGAVEIRDDETAISPAAGAPGGAGGELVTLTENRIGTLAGWAEAHWTRQRHVPETLDDLTPPADVAARFQPVEQWRTDAWGRPFEWRATEASWELRSLGPDGIANTADDIVRRGTFD